MRKSLCVALIGAVTVAAQAADTPDFKPGQYQYNIKTEVPGLPFPMPPVSFSQCVTQKDIDDGKAYQKGEKGDRGDCKMENLKQTRTSASYDVVCSGKNAMTGHYDLTFSDTGFAGKGTMNMGGQVMNTQMSATRTGDCQ